MATREVHWQEGMFLRPHHFQTAQRHWLDVSQRSEKWDLHYNWGLRTVELDRDALSNRRVVVRALRARLRDGTLIDIPEDGVLSEVELKEALTREPLITVFLALPILRVGKANVAGDAAAETARYTLDTQDLEDENTGLNPQGIQVRLMNMRLLLSTQDHSGYEVLPIAQIEKASSSESTPQLDVSYIPPLLAVDAWQPLAAGILESIYDRLGKKIEVLAQQVTTRGITFDSQAQGDPLIFNQLRVLNEAYSILGALVFAQGVHPLPVYVELCRLVGQLAIFGDTRRTPELPRYDHDDLAGCFYGVKKHIDALMTVLVEPEYKERPFVGSGLRLQVSLESAWLESIWQMFVGVQTSLNAEECVRLLTRAGREGLDMKLGSSQRVDEIFRLGEAGLKFTFCPRPPRALPSFPGLLYFQVNRDSQQQEWQQVQRSLTIALRLNENLVLGDIQGQRILKIKAGGQVTTMQFTLYIVPTKA